MTEEVLVFTEGRMEGFSEKLWENKFSSKEIDLNWFWNGCLAYSTFVLREQAEASPLVKQIIPYVVIKQKDKYLRYTRTKSGGEGRLHKKNSIGIGGHINKEDIVGGTLTIGNCIEREIREELIIIMGENSYFVESKQRGVLYDPSNEVGKVHFGLVSIVEGQNINVLPNEDSLSDFCWMTLDELKQDENLENWSQIVVRNL